MCLRWVPALGREFDPFGPTMQLLNGLESPRKMGSGWVNVVRPKLTPEAVTYVNARNILITVPQVPDYDIVAPETISLSIPASAMRNNPSAIPDVTSFVILAARGPRL